MYFYSLIFLYAFVVGALVLSYRQERADRLLARRIRELFRERA